MSTLAPSLPFVRLDFVPRSVVADRGVAMLFWSWLTLRTLVWALAAATQANPPLDTVEWLCWGNQWQLGYHKHPPLPAWLGEAVFWASDGSFTAVYLLGFVCVAVALCSVWRLASDLLPPRPALAATVCLDGLVFLGPMAMEYNNHLPLIAFWSLAVWLFHRACRDDRWRDWLGLGAVLGLAMLCKHSALFLVVSLLAYWLWLDGLRRWTRPAVVAVVAALLVLPHFVWLWQHDFPTLRWVRLRTAGDSGALNHRLSALTFLGGQLLRLLPVLLILLPLLRWRRRQAPGQALLLVAVGGPVVLHLAASLLFGAQLRDIWGAPLWTFAGLLVVLIVQTDYSERAWWRFRLAWVVVGGGLLAGTLAYHGIGLSWRTEYPGGELSAELTSRYRALHGAPPAVIAGDWWMAGNVCVHSPHRPVLYGSLEPSFSGMFAKAIAGELRDEGRYFEPDPLTAPWTSDADLIRRGGILVWDPAGFGVNLPPQLRRRFPQARVQPRLEIPIRKEPWYVSVGWATIPPAR